MTTEERFWNKVDKSGPIVRVELGPCWIWKGARQRSGYGTFLFHGKNQLAHRAAWLISRGNIPAGFDICHECDNTSCCNPAHLFAGTRKQNMANMRDKGRSRGGSIYGERNGAAKLDHKKVAEIRQSTQQPKALALLYSVSVSTIRRVLSGSLWQTPAQQGFIMQRFMRVL